MNLVENEDLAWEHFQKAVTDEDMAACYDTSLKEFKHSAVHDLFKVCDLTFASSCLLHFSRLMNFSFFFFFKSLGNVKVHCSV